jgi:hypothetical protein
MLSKNSTYSKITSIKHNFKGKFQSGGWTIGVVVKAFLRVLKASLQSSSKTNGTSF